MEKHVDVLGEKSSPTCTALNLFVGELVQHFVYLKDIISHVNGEGEFHGAPGMDEYAGLGGEDAVSLFLILCTCTAQRKHKLTIDPDG